MPAIFQDHAIHFRAQLAQGFGFVADCHGRGRGEHGDFQPHLVQFPVQQGREARVAESRGAGVFFHVLPQRSMCLERADAAAQVALLGEGDEGRPGCIQPVRVGRMGGRLVEFAGDGGARQEE